MTKKYIDIHFNHHLKEIGYDIDISKLLVFKTTDNLLIDLVLYTDVRKLVNNTKDFKRLVYKCGYCNLNDDDVEIQEKDFKLYKENPYV